MIRYFNKIDGKLQELEASAPGCWINLSPPFAQDELSRMADELEVPADFLTDSLDIDERSRYEKEEEGRLILLNTPLLNEDSKDNEAYYITVPIGIVLTADHVVTISAVDNPVLKIFQEGRVKHFDPADQERFVLQLFEQVVFRFLACLKKLNHKRNFIEQELYNSSKSSELKQLLRIEKSLVYFVNSLSSNELLKMKMKRTNFLNIRDDETMMDLFEDVIIDNSQALEMSNVHTNILNGTMEAYASIISNNLNFVIQRLTLITLILMVPTLIASYYGMNIKNLPLADKEAGFYYIISISIVLSLVLAWFFRRRRMF
ncbi:MAG: magnesium transporter CorA family protein [Saprospiraceae bacterium]|nr:magnesium transporter CorA family protein [Saprospiraceae bacterium]